MTTNRFNSTNCIVNVLENIILNGVLDVLIAQIVL